MTDQLKFHFHGPQPISTSCWKAGALSRTRWLISSSGPLTAAARDEPIRPAPGSGSIPDGRKYRYRACLEAGIDPKFTMTDVR